jgi:hypothetical protein
VRRRVDVERHLVEVSEYLDERERISLALDTRRKEGDPGRVQMRFGREEGRMDLWMVVIWELLG